MTPYLSQQRQATRLGIVVGGLFLQQLQDGNSSVGGSQSDPNGQHFVCTKEGGGLGGLIRRGGEAGQGEGDGAGGWEGKANLEPLTHTTNNLQPMD